ncbi:hypothetical protein [Pelagibacterium lentulum]|uniref:DUF2007 domain-containing protein n=1 Tax=Pelagibacterium lentulum TaxID=2029865 RepID=A0A916R7A0_9HYPH|nr:hypothetical protein [Pelagibacterium lentulum]GGA35921.1 hypothetical protein GCM10011499_01580 [Pelagibacterium lentulum]
MTDYETIARVKRETVARVLIAALRAHGFSPRDISEGGLPGVGTAFAGGGIPIDVPEREARDAKPLAEALLADMRD